MAEMDGEGDKTVLTVPKFSSFKSKEPAEDSRLPERRHESPPGRRRDGDKPEDHRSSASDRRRSGRNGSREPRRRRDRRSCSREREERRPPRDDRLRRGEKYAAVARPPRGVPGLFVIDAKGDPLIARYGGIDKSQIPAYYRYGAGRVLGTRGRLVIHRDKARDEFSLRMPGDGAAAFAEGDGLRSKRPAIRRDFVAIRPRKSGPEQPEDKGPEDFLPLSSSSSSSRGRKRKREGNLSEEDDKDDGHLDYRSIHGKTDPKRREESEDSDSDSDASMDVAVTPQNNPLRWKSLQLSRQVKEHPEDMDAWIELVDHQDALLKAGEDMGHSVLEDDAHSFAEIKVSMLEKALQNTASRRHGEDRRRVLVYLMREGVKVWSGKTAAKRWAQVLRDEDDHFDLWKAHFDFFISNITAFRFEDGKKMLLDRLRRLAVSPRAIPAAASGDASTDGPGGEAIHIFLLASRFIHDAGYKELAVAAWQGLLEINLFRPQTLTHQQGHLPPDALEALQDFWESEVPRIGESDAKGWRHFVESSGSVQDPPEPVKMEHPQPLASRDAYKAWGHLERAHAARARMPARTMDDDGTQDDPFRVVMFTDIQEFLFLLPSPLPEGALEQLVDALLLFSGAQPAFKSSPWTLAAMRDPMISSSSPSFLFDMDKDVDSPDTDKDTAMDRHTNATTDSHTSTTPPALVPVNPDEGSILRKEPDFKRSDINASPSPWILFSNPNSWFRYSVPREPTCSPVDAAWLAETLGQIVHMAGMEALAPYYMAVRFSLEPSSVKKTAKALLKRFPTNAHIFNAYALAMFAKGEPAVADNVLSSTTQAASLSTPWAPFLLHKSWSWMALQTGTKKLATLRLLSSVDPALRSAQAEVELGRLAVLKARQAFSEHFDELLAAGDAEGAGCLAECLLLLAYLTGEGGTEPTSDAQGSIATAMSVAEGISRDFASSRSSRGLADSTAHEQVLQFAAQLLYFNASKGPFRRSFTRDHLSRFISLFPHNTLYLALYEWADASLRVIDDTRDMLHRAPLARPHDCPSTRLFAIRHEMARGNANTARAAFEQALASDACRGSPALWAAYVRFCCRGGGRGDKAGSGRDRGNKALRSGAKDVFYRSVRHCPASRSVVMEAFGALVGEMGGEELRGVYEQMIGKGMRVHVDLEDFLSKKR